MHMMPVPEMRMTEMPYEYNEKYQENQQSHNFIEEIKNLFHYLIYLIPKSKMRF